MQKYLHRSISQPIREDLSWYDMWEGPDKGLICCWERGREKRAEDPELAEKATRGELIPLAWNGGVQKKLKIEKKAGALQYLATWQGLRSEDLDIDLEGETTIVCSKTKQIVVFSNKLPDENESDKESNLLL